VNFGDAGEQSLELLTGELRVVRDAECIGGCIGDTAERFTGLEDEQLTEPPQQPRSVVETVDAEAGRSIGRLLQTRNMSI